MALPKEPRQKMINMMYLVLTALLALNVSSEILNAFKIVDKSLRASNSNLTSSSSSVMTSFKDKLNDPKTANDARLWYPVAEKAAGLATTVDKMIEDYKGKLKMEAGASTPTDSSFKEDNLDAATRLFQTKKEGDVLYKALEAYRTNLLAVHPEIKTNFEKTLPLKLDQPNSTDWTVKNFHMVPTVAALTILSKLQNDVKNSENQVLNYLHSKVGAVIVKYDKFAALVGQSSNYVMPGEKITVTAGVGAFSNAATPQISVGGRSVPVGPDGTGVIELDGGGAGSRSVTAVVRFKDQDGKDQTVEKEIKWTVGTPGGAAVMLDKMNVLYIGVDNPVTISSGTGWDKTTVTMSGGNLSGSTGKYNVRVTSEGTASITVKTDKGSSTFPFRIKSLPPATAFCGTQKDGNMPAASLRAMGGLRAQLENSEFDAPFKVVSYTITGSGAGFPGGAVSAANENGFWAGPAKAIADKAVPGSMIAFSNIIIVGPDGKPRKAINPSIGIRCQ
jgi:gliding motility-associated protein GldM